MHLMKSPSPDSIDLAVLMTCHNRRERTTACLRSVSAQASKMPLAVQIYLVDDGSSDGTREAAIDLVPNIVVIDGDGTLFWSGGMRRAFSRATADRHDFYLWLNDDVVLYPNALMLLLESFRAVSREGIRPAIVVGAFRDPLTGRHTYGGLNRQGLLRPLRFVPMPPYGRPKPCDTFNGNCVLIPDDVARRIGNISAPYRHALGDLDYGLRAGKLGIKTAVASDYVGECEARPVPRSTVRRVLEKGRVGYRYSPVEWATFASRHGGPFWVRYLVTVFLRDLYTRAVDRLLNHEG